MNGYVKTFDETKLTCFCFTENDVSQKMITFWENLKI